MVFEETENNMRRRILSSSRGFWVVLYWWVPGDQSTTVDGNCAEADLSPPQPDMVLDPCLLDGAWQAALVLMDEPRLLLPQSVSSVTLLSPITEAVSARILARSTADAIELIVDVDLISSDGSVLARVEGLVCAEPPAPANSVDLDLYRSTWSTQTVSELPSTSHRWLLYGKDEASISMLAQHAPVGIDIVNTIKDVERHVSDGAERIVVLADSQQEDPEIHLLDLITLLNAIPDEMNNLRLIVVTRASFALMSGDVISANGHRALWGAVRAIRWERPDWKIDLYDLPDRITSLDGKQFWHACIEGLSSEGAIRNTRLLRHDLDHLRQTDIDSSTARISRSSIQTPLQLDLSGPRPVWRRLPHHVATVGDLRILAVTPAPGFPGRYDALATSAVDDTLLAVCGSEELLASGINRSKIKVSCPIDLPLQSRKPLPMTALSRIEYLRTRLAPGAPVSLELPDGLSLRFLVAFLTAHGHPVYQIGTAPVQFSGSNNMIEFLSRDRLETLTRLSYLAEQGAIYVTSKPDEGWMGSSLARRGYAVAALSETPETAPGSLSPLLTSQGRPDDDLPSGIEQSTNVICPWDRPLLTQGASSLLSPVIGGCCLITGGVSGVGAALAKTMARQGHQNLVLVGRRGPQTPGTSSLISELQQLGATPRIEACDVSDASAVLDLLKRIGPVKTVIHAAGAVIDCSMDQTSAEVVRTAFAAKVNGAKNLKAATAASPPDCMVLIGSLTASVGNRNQVAYASANACLEELADLWRQADESSMVLCFAPGAISDTGTVAQSKAIAARLDKLGISNISVKQIHDRLNLLTHDGNTISCAIFAAIDWSQWAPKVDPRSPLYRLIVSKKGAYHNKKNSEVSFTASEMALVLCNALAAVLRADPASLDTDKPLNTFGIDSLMSVSIALELEQATGVSCDPLDILAARSINELADTLSIRGQRKDGPPSEVREPQFVST
ncbi:SDR family NAD(P)-dependent oxidoreductase [Pseudovibrio denitrificans]|uniref:SDR family NAD(P)-dependent oxidoreductase n=1 Tax=Pseudovibrio denitrificans TaxID=258256 RepID=UPI0006D03ECC|nr:SDR family NAD(P)-dependent oxidoreductase [Pseudovibrio denitrificans]